VRTTTAWIRACGLAVRAERDGCCVAAQPATAFQVVEQRVDLGGPRLRIARPERCERGIEAAAAVEAAMVTVRRRQSRRVLAREAGESPTEDAAQQVLDAVEASPVPLGVTGVGSALGVDQPRASKLAAAAVDAGLLRVADQADGRRSHLALTAEGRATFADLLTRFVAALGSDR
jgi:DNA-binding MarR family transcriptional regulator